MDMKTAAGILNGRQYRDEEMPELFAEMKKAGLVAVFGASDDLMEFRGAVCDEIGAFAGEWAEFNKVGLIVNECDEEDCPYFAKIKGTGAKVHAVWAPKDPDASWLMKTDLPHESFDIFEDDELYCRGLVFSLRDCP